MYHWFTNHTGDNWTPQDGYNQTFAELIGFLKQMFDVKRESVGVYTNGSWQPVEVNKRTSDGGATSKYTKIFVRSLEVNFKGYARHDGYLTPEVVIRLEIAKERKGNKEVFFSPTLLIHFPSNYPKSPPYFQVKGRRVNAMTGASHEHHLLRGGWLCVLSGANQWLGASTIVQAVLVAIDHSVWHHEKFGD